jgi:hypothetical protein
MVHFHSFCQEVTLHSPLNKEENRDLISPVQTPVEFYTLFFIIRASTANQGKRKQVMSFFCIHLTANKSNHLFFLLVIFFDMGVTVF